jgi:hypothetical protein
VLKDFFNHLGLVDEADDAHLALAFGTGKGICLVNLADKVGPAFF